MSLLRTGLFFAPLMLSSIALACGGTVIGNSGGNGGSGGTKGSAMPDGGGGRHDASRPVDTGIEAGPPTDHSVPNPEGSMPGPVQVATGKDLVLWGVTNDGYAVYSQASLSSTVVYAASVTGGTPVEIDTLSSSYSQVLVAGPDIFVLNDVTSKGGGTLETWTAKGGLHTLSKASYVYLFDYSADYGRVAYLDNFNASLQTADAYVANVDGTGATLLHSGVLDVDYPSSCYPELVFTGSSVALSFCNPATAMTGDVYSYSSPSWKEVSISSGGYPYFTFSKSNGSNLVLYSTSGLEVAPVSGGPPTVIDPAGQQAFFTSDGANVVYVNASGALMRSPVASPSPTMLASGGIIGILDLSADDSIALVYKSYDSMTYLTDLYTASATKEGPLTTLSSTSNVAVAGVQGGGSIVYGSPFTSDGSHALYFSAVSMASYPYLGTLQASPVGMASHVTLGSNTNTAWASGNSKVVFEDNFALLSGSTVATIEIKSVDTKAGESPTVVVSQANAGAYYGSFYLTADGSQVVFTQNGGKGGAAGVFVTAVP